MSVKAYILLLLIGVIGVMVKTYMDEKAGR